ncbi:trihelix transcription factor ASIL2-like [Asparagus officinalis]|uniref:trihelix transcription factor ASIL2-like n=1 Tax=Asparagus officinalis TaxID=4686 RepID=UPI00098E3ED9|nr:trihelix transcription factor ASIL2-like [Asparagus officinalis]
MGPSSSSAGKRSPVISPPRRPRLMFTVKPRKPNPSSSSNVGGFSGGSWRFGPQESSSESSLGENDKELDGDEGEDRGGEKRKWEGLVGCERGGGGGGGGGEMGQLARAIVNFAGVYERVESAKQQQMMELERHRMEFVKELEFKRMKMFMEVQLEMERMKMKRRKKSSSRLGEIRIR